MKRKIIIAIAGHELQLCLRNRWVLTFACVLAALMSATSYFGLATSAIVGFQSFTRTSASLLNLVLYLVPLVALMMTALSFSGEKSGSELLFSQPVTRTEVVIGKFGGLWVAMCAAILLGFGISGFIVGWNAGIEGFGRFTVFAAFTVLLAGAFTSVGALAGVVSKLKSRVIIGSLCVWLFFVLLYDLLVIGGVFLLRQHTANLLIFGSLFGNPIDLVRVSALIALGGATIFGAAGSALLKTFGSTLSVLLISSGALLIWILAPLIAACWTLERRDI